MRVRFRFTKLGKVRFTSHRDVARLWERALRRAQLPVARTEGFSPRPKVHFGLALSTGHESLAEFLDVDLVEPDGAAVDLAGLPAVLTPLLPEGLVVEAAAPVPAGATSLQQAVTSCTWQIDVPDLDPTDAAARVERVLAAPTLVVTRERKGQPVTDDLRPAVLDLWAEPGVGRGTCLRAELATHPRGVRPAELLAAFEPPIADPLESGGRVVRRQQWIETDGAKREPLGGHDATPVAPATVRAS